MLKRTLLPWLPAVLVMAVIFWFSSSPSTKMPDYGLFDLLVKKGGHMLGYGILALAYWRGLRFEKHCWWLALLLAVIYATTDEFHQVFVPGRHPSGIDVLLFDGCGAAIALGLMYFLQVKRARKYNK
jgi:VanZ family protein